MRSEREIFRLPAAAARRLHFEYELATLYPMPADDYHTFAALTGQRGRDARCISRRVADGRLRGQHFARIAGHGRSFRAGAARARLAISFSFASFLPAFRRCVRFTILLGLMRCAHCTAAQGARLMTAKMPPWARAAPT